jgi:hypothetical protein
VAEQAGDTARAGALWEDCLAVFREQGDRLRVGLLLRTLAFLARADGDRARARALLRESFTLLGESGHAAEVAQGLYRCGDRAVRAGEAARGVRLIGAAVALHPPLADGLEPGGIAEIVTTEGLATGAILDAARAALGEPAVALAWADGQALTAEPAVAEALAWAGGPDGAPSDPGPA